jgi:hypothetical protein
MDRFDSMRVFVKVAEAAARNAQTMPVIGIVACFYPDPSPARADEDPPTM